MPAITSHRLPTPIVLAPSWPRRLLDQASDALAQFVAWRQRRAQVRAEQERAALYRALVSQLDSATLRDLGLGDWVAARGAGRWIDVDRF